MLKSPYLLAIAVWLTLLHWAGAAHAQERDFALSFDLPSAGGQTAAPTASPSSPTPIAPVSIPSAIATSAPIKIATADVDEDLAYVQEALPPIEEVEETTAEPTTASTDSVELTFSANTISLESPKEERFHTENEDDNPDGHSTEDNNEVSALIRTTHESAIDADAYESSINTLGLDDWIFKDGSNSLVARTVGSAEGTRQSDGKYTQAYYGHVDPGNGVWNLGTFSYQHGAKSPEAADEKQLRRLKQQGLELESQAIALGLDLSLEEKLNGLDLANQAPLAALEEGGYIERLAQAKRLQMESVEAILWARTYAYIDPDTRRWNAPGLGNNVHSISKDQQRRISAISQAMKAYDPPGMEIAALNHLNQISLAGTSERQPTEQSPTTTETATTSSTAAGGDDSVEISFVLPPTGGAVEDAAVSRDTASIANGSAISTVSPVLSEASEAITSETITSQAITSQANTSQSNASQSASSDETSLTVTYIVTDNIGITFIPTGDIAAQPTPVGLSTGLENTNDIEEAATEAATDSSEPDLFSLDAAETHSISRHGREYTEPELTELNLAPVSSAQVSDQTGETVEVATEVEVRTEKVEAEEAGENSATKLQALLAGIEPTDLIDIDVLRHETAQSEPQGALWRIEDKIVPAKR